MHISPINISIKVNPQDSKLKKRECVAFLAWTLFCVARLLSPKLIKSMLFLRVGLIDLMSH